jgi:hypothetical protein
MLQDTCTVPRLGGTIGPKHLIRTGNLKWESRYFERFPFHLPCLVLYSSCPEEVLEYTGPRMNYITCMNNIRLLQNCIYSANFWESFSIRIKRLCRKLVVMTSCTLSILHHDSSLNKEKAWLFVWYGREAKDAWFGELLDWIHFRRWIRYRQQASAVSKEPHLDYLFLSLLPAKQNNPLSQHGQPNLRRNST